MALRELISKDDLGRTQLSSRDKAEYGFLMSGFAAELRDLIQQSPVESLDAETEEQQLVTAQAHPFGTAVEIQKINTGSNIAAD